MTLLINCDCDMYARGRDIGRENENVREGLSKMSKRRERERERNGGRERVIEGVKETEEDKEEYRKNVTDRQTCQINE